MRYEENRKPNRYTQNIPLSESTLRKRVLICILVLIFCIAVKFYPDEDLLIVRNSISYIVNHNTDVMAEFEKLKSFFKKDSSLETLNPVSELIAPSSGKIIKGFGMQDASGSTFHYGVEISAKSDENIVAANDGKITEIAKSEEYGSYIVIAHSEEITTLYGNLNEIIPNVGDRVEKGQAIARADSEKKSVYFELKRGDTFLDPTQFIDFEE